MARLTVSAFRDWKLHRRLKNAEAEILGRRSPSTSHGLRTPLIVSLTSYPARFNSLHLVLRSLLTQSVRADRIVLWLYEEDEQHLPHSVLELGIETRVCPNWRCYKKIVPSLMEWPEAHIVTADDDVYYGPDWLAGLVRHAEAGVVCHRAHRVALNAAGEPRSYVDWERNIPTPDCSPLIFPTGVGGVLYAPNVFHPDICRTDLFHALAPSADDVWLYWMHRLAGSRPAKIGGRFRIIEWDGTQAQNLRAGNLAGDGNDQAIRAMFECYGPPGESERAA